MVQKLKLRSSDVVFQNDKVTKVEIWIDAPYDIMFAYWIHVLNKTAEEWYNETDEVCDFVNKMTIFTGVAKRKDSDLRDDVVGVAVAEAKAWVKAKTCYRNALIALHNNLFAMQEDIYETIEDLESDIAHNLDYISRK